MCYNDFGDVMEEQVVGPMPFEHACRYLSNLITNSRAFIGGSKPYIGRLKTSYGYKKVIGIVSFDHQVRTRIDYDPFKGYHFNFENFTTGEKICILINDMTKDQYERYIDTLTKGRGPIETPKMPNFSYKYVHKGEVNYQFVDERAEKIAIEESKLVEKIINQLARDKFVMDYYNELINLEENFEMEFTFDEIRKIYRKRANLNTKIIKNVLFVEYLCNQNGFELDTDELYDTYLNEDSFKDNYNHFRK